MGVTWGGGLLATSNEQFNPATLFFHPLCNVSILISSMALKTMVKDMNCQMSINLERRPEIQKPSLGIYAGIVEETQTLGR